MDAGKIGRKRSRKKIPLHSGFFFGLAKYDNY